MCYGTCNLESYMGGCSVLSSKDQIKNDVGYYPCFIGGAVTCPEEDELYKELLETGEIDIMMKIVWDIQQIYLDRYKTKRP